MLNELDIISVRFNWNIWNSRNGHIIPSLTEVEIHAVTDNIEKMEQSIMQGEQIGDKMVYCGHVFKNIYAKSFEFINGNGKVVLMANECDDNDLEQTVKVKFKDIYKNIKVGDYINIAKEYGNPEDMIYREFEDRLLALKI